MALHLDTSSKTNCASCVIEFSLKAGCLFFQLLIT